MCTCNKNSKKEGRPVRNFEYLCNPNLPDPDFVK